MIEAINNISSESLALVAPNSLRLKTLVKVPMLMMIFCSANMSSLSVVFMKLATELIESGQFTENLVLTFVMLGLMSFSAFFQIHMINNAMKYYD